MSPVIYTLFLALTSCLPWGWHLEPGVGYAEGNNGNSIDPSWWTANVTLKRDMVVNVEPTPIVIVGPESREPEPIDPELTAEEMGDQIMRLLLRDGVDPAWLVPAQSPEGPLVVPSTEQEPVVEEPEDDALAKALDAGDTVDEWSLGTRIILAVLVLVGLVGGGYLLSTGRISVPWLSKKQPPT